MSDTILKLLESYITNRKQKAKINNVFSDVSDTLFGVPQGTALGKILLNIFINELIRN